MNRRGSVVVTLPSARAIRIRRTFDAAPAAVFTAWTTPEHVQRWWGSETAPLVVCEIDLRVGGAWRYVTRDVDGTELAWRGEFVEIARPHRLVSTQVFEPHPEGAATTTLTLDEQDGVTVMTVDVLHTSRAHRDATLASGMERGMRMTMDRLEDLLCPPPTGATPP
jgi:uncharacterized protein YndB with AHSA1/START domain